MVAFIYVDKGQSKNCMKKSRDQKMAKNGTEVKSGKKAFNQSLKNET